MREKCRRRNVGCDCSREEFGENCRVASGNGGTGGGGTGGGRTGGGGTGGGTGGGGTGGGGTGGGGTGDGCCRTDGGIGRTGGGGGGKTALAEDVGNGCEQLSCPATRPVTRWYTRCQVMVAIAVDHQVTERQMSLLAEVVIRDPLW